MMWMNKMKEMMKQEGVTDHGRVAQPDLIPELEASAIWAYPTHFGEINCISAIKAQAYGCEPVVVNYAALKETVQYGRKVEGDIYDDETKDNYKQVLIDTLKHPMIESKREEMMKWAKSKYNWDTVVSSWDKVFKETK
jgi:glycosyltransferase involved in cell wall biosynthesis